ncbi:MAG: CpaF family protein [Firmicutes bacterium]|nr:CpaF family protein [Bacillota bacterium]
MEEASKNWLEITQEEKKTIIDELSIAIFQKNTWLGEKALIGEHRAKAEEVIRQEVAAHQKVAPNEIEEFVATIIGQATGYGKLDPFFNGPEAEDITEVMVNPSPEGPRVFYGKEGRTHEAKQTLFRSDDEVRRYAQKICESAGRPFNEQNPIVDAWLPDGSRVAVMGFKACPLGTVITIRKSPLVRPPLPLEKMIESETFPPFVVELMVELLVKGHANLGVFGRTDSGKTTLLRALGLHIDPWERVLIGETSFELSFPHLRNCINLVEVTIGKTKYISMTDICEAFNRNNPDRTLVGEIRGAEIVAASEIAESTSGGFWTCGHAGSVNQLRQRMPKMFRRGNVNLPMDMVDEQMQSMFHFLIFVDKDTSGKRALMELVEVNEEGYRPIIRFDTGELARSKGKTRRWIYENPITPERLGQLTFRGATMKDEYEKIHEKYLYSELMA